jgi:Fur family ferric uptake transcriptional regulator
MHNDLEVLFADRQLRLTTPRRKVFEILHESETPLQIGEIIKNCPDIDRVSIYRTLELFTKLGITDIVPLGWKQRYELTSPFKPHHHHLYCTNCGKLIDVHSQKLEQVVAAIARDYNFSPTEHKFEVSGLCKECSTKHQAA